MTEPTRSNRYIITLVKERHYDSDLPVEDNLATIILELDPVKEVPTEWDILNRLRAAGALTDTPIEDYYDPDSHGASYHIDITPAPEVASVDAAIAVFTAALR